jgi:hypothetical protein
MFHSLLILLHRPFIFDGHLKAMVAHARDEFRICESAACDIDIILQWYKQHWCVETPPYFLSYATYVSATIHMRVAAQKPHGEAHRRLNNCLEILSENQNVYHAPRRAMANLLPMIQRLGIDVGNFSALTSRTAQCETLRAGHGDEGIQILSPTESETRSSQIDSAINLATPSANPGDIAPVGVNELQGEAGLDVGDVPDWIAFFDLDPIYGFDDFSENTWPIT